MKLFDGYLAVDSPLAQLAIDLDLRDAVESTARSPSRSVLVQRYTKLALRLPVGIPPALCAGGIPGVAVGEHASQRSRRVSGTVGRPGG